MTIHGMSRLTIITDFRFMSPRSCLIPVLGACSLRVCRAFQATETWCRRNRAELSSYPSLQLGETTNENPPLAHSNRWYTYGSTDIHNVGAHKTHLPYSYTPKEKPAPASEKLPMSTSPHLTLELPYSALLQATKIGPTVLTIYLYLYTLPCLALTREVANQKKHNRQEKESEREECIS